MKKYIVITGAALVTTIIVSGLFYSHKEHSLGPATPPVTLPASADTSSKQVQSPSTSTQADSADASSNESILASAAPRTDIIQASPKQTEIRQNTGVERTYLPLATPNDPGYATSNWALTGINAPAAWDIATGDNSTVIAVLDTGFALNHEDLSSAWYANSGETGTTATGDFCWTGTSADKSTNNCDDDRNGYVDDWRGWNFFNGTNNPMAGQNNADGDAVEHGTEVAGLAGAVGNNGKGIATVNWSTKLMPLKVMSDDGPGYTSDIAAAIYYAVDNGADIINLSLGGNEEDPMLLDATNYAYENDVLVVAAAGNCGTGTEPGCEAYPAGFISYPARNPHVISVGATTSSKQRASFSSYGDALDIVAPGSGSIYSPTWTPGNSTTLYATSLYGTSFASPIVASLASLIASERPSASVDDLTALLLASAQKTNVPNGVYVNELGHGGIDASKSLTVAASLNATSSTPTLLQTGNYRSEHSYTANSTMSSGCKASQSVSYCTIGFERDDTGYQRFLPYTLTSNSYASWWWNTSILDAGAWKMHAVQGGVHSTDYSLSTK